jgi:hypothetical protein
LDSIPEIAYLTMRLPIRPAPFQTSFLAKYREIVAPIAAAKQTGETIVHCPYILLHMRGQDDNTYKPPLD